jgi:hypothetical protein
LEGTNGACNGEGSRAPLPYHLGQKLLADGRARGAPRGRKRVELALVRVPERGEAGEVRSGACRVAQYGGDLLEDGVADLRATGTATARSEI